MTDYIIYGQVVTPTPRRNAFTRVPVSITVKEQQGTREALKIAKERFPEGWVTEGGEPIASPTLEITGLVALYEGSS